MIAREQTKALLAFVDEQRACNDDLYQLGAKMPPPDAIPVAVIRRNRLLGKGGFAPLVVSADARDVVLKTGRGEIPSRLFPVKDRAATCIHVHGGGWVFGSVQEQDPRLSELAGQTQAEVVSIGYRLAPEDPYPAAVDDCVNAVIALADGPSHLCHRKLVISGESAGAHLAVLMLLRLRSRPDIIARIAGLSLCYGIYDLSMTPSQRRWGDEHMILSTPVMRWMQDQFLPGLPMEERRRPDISPIYDDLLQLPPALFTVGTKDMLVDDSLFMAARWQAAGNTTELAVYPEAPHGFNALPTAMAKAGNARIFQFFNDCISAHDG